VRILLATFFSLLILTAVAFAQEGKVSEFILGNGMKVLLKENHNAPVINFNVAYRVGSKYERPGITGISHLLEHIMFKTTTNHPLGEFDNLLQEVGAENNANTWLDRTIYYETIAADKIDIALELDADRMRNLAFIPDDHRLEMPVVRNELEQRNDSPFTLLYEEMLAHAYKAHPYGIPTIGWVDDIEGITTEDIREFYNRWYHPDNAFIVAVGDFETEEMLAKIEQHFGSIPSGNVKHPRLPVEPEQNGERRFILKRAGQVDMMMNAWHVPEGEHPDSFALVVLANILGNGRTSRLYNALVNTGKCAEAGASNDAFGYADPFLFLTYAVANPGVALTEIEPLIYAEIERIKTGGVTDEELNRAKKQARVSFVFEQDSIVSQADTIMSFELYNSGWQNVDKYLPGIESVTDEQVRRVAAQYLHEDNRTVGHYLAQQPEGGEGGPAAGEEGAPSRFDSVGPLYYREPGQHAAALENAAPLPGVSGVAGGVTVAVETSGEPYAQEFKLPNGLTVLVRENHSNPSVSLSGLVRAGAIDDPADLPGVAGLAVGMLGNGTEAHTKAELAAIEENAAVAVGFSAGRETTTFSGRSLSEDFSLMLDLLAEQLLTPSFPAEELDLLRQQTIAGIQINLNDTEYRAGQAAQLALYGPGSPYSQPESGTVESVTAIDRDDLVNWYDAYVVPDGAIITVVGDVDAEAVRAAVAQRFGAWRGSAAAHNAQLEKSDDFLPVGGRGETVVLADKSNVTLLWAGPGKSRRGNEWPVAQVANYIMGGGFTTRLNQRLRIEEGLTYGAYSYFASSYGAGPWNALAQVNPENVDPAVKATTEELTRYFTEGPADAEVATARNYLIGSFPVRLSTNGAVAGELTQAVYLERGVNYLQDYARLVSEVSMEDVQALIHEYMDPAKLYLVKSGTLAE
jgi:zinc protease